jgi:cell division transport system permease protein
MGRLIYFLGEAFRGLFHARLMTSVSIITISVTLFMLGLSATGYLTIKQSLSSVSRQPGLVVYFQDTLCADRNLLDKTIMEISTMPQISGTYFVGKDSAWKRFENLYGSEMLDAVDENPLPASLEISLKESSSSIADIEKIKNGIELINGVEGVRYSREWFEIIRKLGKWFAIVTALVVPFILLALHFMIANTIKLTIYARKDIVLNMRYVGATDFYIQAPFVLEGILQGTFGGLIGVAALFFARLGLSGLPLCWGPPFFPGSVLFMGVFCAGVLFGWMGSLSAVRKFLL